MRWGTLGDAGPKAEFLKKRTRALSSFLFPKLQKKRLTDTLDMSDSVLLLMYVRRVLFAKKYPII